MTFQIMVGFFTTLVADISLSHHPGGETKDLGIILGYRRLMGATFISCF